MMNDQRKLLATGSAAAESAINFNVGIYMLF